jgi:spore protease
MVLTVDALAARSCERLSSTIQLSDRGIGPGSGIGNLRKAIDRQTLGCPVLALGVPTVVDSATLVWDALEQAGVADSEVGPSLRQVLQNGRSFIVSPRESDRITELASVTLAHAIDRAFGVSEK